MNTLAEDALTLGRGIRSAPSLAHRFNIENYVNDPRNTPEDQLITEILFPVE